MAPPRKTGKPKQLEEEEDAATENQSEETLDSFLRDIHGESTVSIQEEGVPPGEGIPSIGWLRSHFKTKSATIRYLTITRQFPLAKVAKHLGLKYQHVRNVTTQQLKRGPNEDFHLADGQATNLFKSVENSS